MAGSRGRWWRVSARVALGAGLALALAACNTPSAGGPGLEPPGGGDSNDFGAGPGEAMSPTGGAGNAGGVPNVPGADPGTKGEPSSTSDAGATVEDASTPAADAGTDAESVDGEVSWAPSCDERKVDCQKVADPCPMGEVRRVEAGCWAECIPIDVCGCDEPADCANELIYTCHMFKMRCGPYL